jgi:excinuclease ABC subunit C
MDISRLKEKIKKFPARPGIYFFKNASGEVIYIGKARSLKDRVKSYFLPNPDFKVQNILSETADVDYLLVSSEKEASFIENNYIQFYQPKFNLRLKDDKSFPFLKLTVNEPYPGLYLSRRVEDDGARYFGPFSPADDTRRLISLLTRSFHLRTCENTVFRSRKRPCLEYDLKLCSAPCCQFISEEDYRQEVARALMLLEGRKTELIEQLRLKMDQAAEALQFEEAAHWRDVIKALENLQETQRVISTRKENLDIVGYARQADLTSFFLFHMREGRIRSSSGRLLEKSQDSDLSQLLVSTLLEFYATREVPDNILLPISLNPEEKAQLCDYLKNRNTRCQLLFPTSQKKQWLLELANQNARLMLEKLEDHSPLAELRQVLKLKKWPQRIEGFDISNTAGQEAVGSLVVFLHGYPDKSEYRKYRIKTVRGPDDFASIREVLLRRLRRLLEEKKPLPDLIFVDGGKGQLSAAREVLEELGLQDLDLCSLAKKEEILYSAAHPDGLKLDPTSPALKLIQQVRDEAHRLAITFHRQRRQKKSFSSELDGCPGLGPKRKKKLLSAFGHLEKIKKASVEELAGVVGKKTALAIKKHLDSSGRTE